MDACGAAGPAAGPAAPEDEEKPDADEGIEKIVSSFACVRALRTPARTPALSKSISTALSEMAAAVARARVFLTTRSRLCALSVAASRSPLGLASAAAALEQRRQSSTLLLGGLGVAGVALAARYALKTFAPAEPESGVAAKDGTAKDGKEAAAPVSHKAFGAEYWARRMYTGGFEGSMSRREAALILGIRESADAKKVQERHKKMLISNHPDHGGSAFIASKINEAKDVFLKGERSKS